MYAINAESRIAMAKIMFAEVEVLAARARDERFPLFHLTVVPELFALPLRQADQFDPYKFRTLLKKEFAGVNMFGFMEAGFFARASILGHEPGIVSNHAHMFAWGQSSTVMKRRVHSFAKTYQCFLPELDSAHVVSVKPDKLLGLAEYHYKSPINSYAASTFERMDPTTGVFFGDYFTKIWKEAMGLGGRVRLYKSCLSRLKIPELVVA